MHGIVGGPPDGRQDVEPQLISANGAIADYSQATPNKFREVRYPTIIGGVDATDIRFLMPNFYNQNNVDGEQPLLNDILFKIAFERIDPSVAYLAPFENNARPTFGPNRNIGAFRISDPVDVHLEGGETILIHLEQSVEAGKHFVNMISPVPQINGFASPTQYVGHAGETGTWIKVGDAIENNINAIVAGVVGIPKRNYVSVAIHGDSIPYGTGDARDKETGCLGFVQRGLYKAGVNGAPIPSIKLCKPGEKAEDIANGHGALRNEFLPFTSDIYFNHGTNDLAKNPNLKALQNRLIYIAKMWKSRGPRVHYMNMMPRTNKGNDTPIKGFEEGGARDQLIEWAFSQVENGTFTSVVDVASAVQNPKKPWLWRDDYTGDGIHLDKLLTLECAKVIEAHASKLRDPIYQTRLLSDQLA